MLVTFVTFEVELAIVAIVPGISDQEPVPSPTPGVLPCNIPLFTQIS